jgi:putative nucleotidyltransferase with HDIG domain
MPGPPVISPLLSDEAREENRARRVTQPLAATVSLIVLMALIIVSISPTLYFEHWDYPLGAVVTRDLRTPFSLMVPDQEKREELVAAAREGVKIVYVMDVQAASQAVAKVQRTFALLNEIIPPGALVESADEPEAPTTASLAEADDQIRRELGVNLPHDVLVTLARNRRNEQFRHEMEEVFNYLLMDRGIEINDRASTLMGLQEQRRVEIDFKGGPKPLDYEGNEVLDESEAPTVGVNDFLEYHSLLRGRDQREALREVVAALITGNIWPDEQETERRVAAAEGSVSLDAYSEFYRKGQMIAQAGQRIDRRQWLALRAIDEQKPFYLMLNFLGNAGLVAALMIFLLLYMRRFKTDWAYTSANVNMLGLPLVLVLVIARVADLVIDKEPLASYLFPAGALGMIGAILIGPRMGLLILFTGCSFFGFMNQMDFQGTMIAVVGGTAAVASLFALRRRRDILRAGLFAGAANALAILTIKFIDNPALMVFYDWVIPAHMGIGLINGITCSMITLMSLVVFEHFFRVTTDLNLIELTSLKTPLLRELEEKTPGTYQHTLNVSKLAEAAAEAIGANYLLVRAGAHYHDVGKLAKPKYFTENQATAEERRIHSKLAPSLSALIIKEHVKKGIELAKLHRLPEKVIDFIPQHHGTSLIKYFFTEAQRRFAMGETSDPVREEEFRYPGPRPQTAETAILMLADATEATATAKMTGSTVKRDDVERLVRDTIREKFNDGQLDECNLTLSDLHHIRESFVKSLLARYHHRIDYPQAAAVSRA